MKFEQIIKLKLNDFKIEIPIKEEQSIVKEGFPIPSPGEKEDKDTYVSRCVSSIIDEYGQEQALAICITKYDEK